MKNSQRNAAQATGGTPERIRVNRNNSPDAHRRPAGKLLGLPLFPCTAHFDPALSAWSDPAFLTCRFRCTAQLRCCVADLSRDRCVGESTE
jgi:hypothetical protein